MALSMLAVQEVAEAALNCVCEALDRLPAEVPGLAGCPCRVCVVPGAPAADGCDGGCNVPPGSFPGQLTVNVARLYPSDRTSFPRETGLLTIGGGQSGIRDLKNCAMPQVTAVELVVTLWRCAPLPTDAGCPPTCAELSATAMQMHADMLAVQQGLLCCFSATNTTARHGRRWVMGQTTSLGPQGGCAGFETRLTVALDDCLACPVPTPTAAPVGP